MRKTFLLLVLAGVAAWGLATGRLPVPFQRPVTPPPLTLAAVEEIHALAEEWLVQNLSEQGLFVYEYDVARDRYGSRNNELRQLMASRLLGELAQARPELEALHRRNIEFVLTHWFHEKQGIGYIEYNGKSKLGANAMGLRALVWSPFYAEHATKAKALAEGILSLMAEDGSFEPWLIEPDYDYDKERLLTFYSGEALLALVEYYEKSGDGRVLDAVRKSQDFYIDLYVENMAANYYPAYVPWHTLSLSKLHHLTGEPRYPEAIFRLNDKLIELQDEREYPGRFYNKAFPQYGSPHASSDAVYTESLAYAYEAALLAGDAVRAKRYRRALALAIPHLASLQFTVEEVAPGADPARAVGALRTRAGGSLTRVDNTQHAMDALRKLHAVLSAGEVRDAGSSAETGQPARR